MLKPQKSQTVAEILEAAKRLVVKIGSATLVDSATGEPRKNWLLSLAADIKSLRNTGKSVVVVTSGAIALGRSSLSIPLDRASRDIPMSEKQAAAAVGQIRLTDVYRECMAQHGMPIAQILLTPHDMKGVDGDTRHNARNTLETLLEHGIIPVINENDTTATTEIRFGDNDNLAAQVTSLIEAEAFVMLSTTDGLYTADPRTDTEARHISLVEDFAAALAVSQDAPSGLSTGGMKSKIGAAKLAHESGAHVIITSGDDDHPLQGLLKGGLKRSTLIPAMRHHIS